MIPAWSPKEPSQCPWSRNTLRKVGKALTSDEPWPEGLPTFEDVSLWYQEIVGFVQATLYHLDLSSVIGDIEVTINGRTKTHGTLKEKLIREKSVPLHNIQDVAGVRFEADMTLSQQSGVVTQIGDHFRAIGWRANTKDYRTEPGHANYRAVHIRLERESDKARAEIQIRTRLQGLWANVYEKLADAFGREIRYGLLPDDAEQRELIIDWQDKSLDIVFEAEASEEIIELAGKQILELDKELQSELIKLGFYERNEITERLDQDRLKRETYKQNLMEQRIEIGNALEEVFDTLSGLLSRQEGKE